MRVWSTILKERGMDYCVGCCCSVTESYPTLCNPMDCSTPGLPAPHYLPEFAQIHLDWVGDAILCRHLFLLPSIFPSIRVFSSELALCIRWPKYWNSSFSISPCDEYSGLISFKIDWFDLLAVKGTLKSLLQCQVQKHQFFGALSSLWSYPHICKWLLERPKIWLCGPLSAKWHLYFLRHCLGLS